MRLSSTLTFSKDIIVRGYTPCIDIAKAYNTGVARVAPEKAGYVRQPCLHRFTSDQERGLYDSRQHNHNPC
ncbi:hypothetical protein VCR4J5_670009 [Vibrio crassostreae]|uniref:Uncharacterized protein n=1 Tax=Vibrio crassostreae TaxID=246167 RepID=A0ABM9QWZ3_9VIBR|nr:hypothetical protein VCR4J5_670009 [Vibrio crassostreae]